MSGISTTILMLLAGICIYAAVGHPVFAAFLRCDCGHMWFAGEAFFRRTALDMAKVFRADCAFIGVPFSGRRSVNVRPWRFVRPDLVAQVRNALGKHEIAPDTAIGVR
jgi:hypothetical protein